MYTCVHVCIYNCIYEFTYVCMHICMTSITVCMYGMHGMYVCVYVCAIFLVSLSICFTTFIVVGLGGLGVRCSSGDPRFVGSNPAEIYGFSQDVKILSTSPPGGTLSWGSLVRDFRLVKEPQV